MSDLENRVRELERTVRVLSDRAAIEALRFRYHVCVNERSLSSIDGLFVEGGEVDFGPIGRARGREEIRSLYREVVGTSPFIKQFIHNHVITLDGDRATGLSYLDARTVRDEESVLVAGRFDDVYERSDAGWQFRSLRLVLDFAVPLADGWAAAIASDRGDSRDPER